jgi:hypothetical protein
MLEAYDAQQSLDEGIGGVLRAAGRAIPGLQTAYGLGLGAYRLAKGDKVGAGLAAASAIPGPVGWTALAADIARDSGVGKGTAFGKPQDNKSATAKSTPTAPTKPGGSGVVKDLSAFKAGGGAAKSRATGMNPSQIEAQGRKNLAAQTPQIVKAAGGKGGTVTSGTKYASTLGGKKGNVTYDTSGKKTFTAS